MMNNKAKDIIILCLIIVNVGVFSFLFFMSNNSKVENKDEHLYVIDENGMLNINGKVVKSEGGYPRYVEDSYTQFNYIPNGYEKVDVENTEMICFTRGFCEIKTDVSSRDFWYADLEIIEYNNVLYCNSKDSKCSEIYLVD